MSTKATMVAAFALLACQSQGTAKEKLPPAAPAPEIEAAEEIRAEHKDPAEIARVGRRLAVTLEQHPDPFLGVRLAGAVGLAGAAGSLRPQIHRPLSFRPAIPGAKTWSDVHVGRFTARLPGGVQESVPLTRIDKDGLLAYEFAAPGPAMLMFCAGPKNDAPSRSWFEVSHCSKIIVNVTDGSSRVDDRAPVNVVGETGMPFDVVPLLSPIGMAVGSVLPVSFVVMNEELENAEVAARRPDGSIDRQVTNALGVASFTLSQPGRWLIRMVKGEGKDERIGELVFEIGEGAR